MILEGACGEGKVTKLRDELQKLAENGPGRKARGKL